jgi:hypothetical protein
VQSRSERCPFQATETSTGWSLRTTTDCFGTAPEHSWVDQIRSLPEVTFTAITFEETSQVQAGDDRVVSVIVNTTEWPAYAVPLTEGVATTSLSAQAPVGLASGVGDGEGVFFLADRPVLRADASGVVCGVSEPVAGVLLDAAAPTGRASGLPEPLLPRRRAIAKTRAKATAARSSRRVQYTRAGSGPRGRVTAVMAPR